MAASSLVEVGAPQRASADNGSDFVYSGAGEAVATDNVTLDIMSGELRCIIGPNGAGKSTLFSLLCGIHRPDSGAVILKGQDVTRLPAFRRVRLGLGLTFQTNRAYHHLSVRQNLEIPIPPAGYDGAKGLQERYASTAWPG